MGVAEEMRGRCSMHGSDHNFNHMQFVIKKVVLYI